MRLLPDTGDDAHRGGGPAAGGLPRHPLLPALRGLPGARLALQAAGGAAREVTPVTVIGVNDAFHLFHSIRIGSLIMRGFVNI